MDRRMALATGTAVTVPAATAFAGTRRETMLRSVTDYFDGNPRGLEVLRSICEGTSPVSSRFVEWFISSYAREHPVVFFTDLAGGYSTTPDSEGRFRHRVNVHVDFRCAMRTLTKNYFDPFRRKQRVTYLVRGGREEIDTTIAQMMFVRWMHRNGIYQYIVDHRHEKAEAAHAAHIKRAPTR